MSAALHVDWTACDRRGLCAELLPGVVALDDWGYPVALGYGTAVESVGGDIPLTSDAVAGAREAVALCPRLALSIRGTARV